MKFIRFAMLLASVLFVSQHVTAQSFSVPKNYSLKNPEDFPKYSKEVIDCINWLEKTPIDEQVSKRKEAGAFFMEWITGSPDVSIEIHSYVVGFSDKNPELLLAYMGGWTRFALENPAEGKNPIKGSMAGLKSVIKVYKAGNGIKKDKDVDKIIQLDAKGELEAWVKEQSAVK